MVVFMKTEKFYVCAEKIIRGSTLDEMINCFLEIEEVEGFKAFGIEYLTEDNDYETVDVLLSSNGVLSLSNVYSFHHRKYNVVTENIKGIQNKKIIIEKFEILLKEIRTVLAKKITIGDMIATTNKVLKDNFEKFKKGDCSAVYYDRADAGILLGSLVEIKKPVFYEKNNIIWNLNYEKNVIKFKCRNKNTGNSSWDSKQLRTTIAIEMDDTKENIEKYFKMTPYEVEMAYE